MEIGEDGGLAGAAGQVIDDVAVFHPAPQGPAMRLFRLMNADLTRVKLLQKAKLHHHVRADHVAICLHDVTQLDLVRREIMISQLVGKAQTRNS